MLVALLCSIDPLSTVLGASFVVIVALLLIVAAQYAHQQAGSAPGGAGSPNWLGDIELRLEALERQAGFDEVTRLPNARKLDQHALPAASHQAAVLHQALTVAALSLDGLDELRRAHPERCDSMLIAAARVTEKALRQFRCTDRVYRYRHDRFVVLLAGADETHANDILSNVLAFLRAAKMPARIGAVVQPVGESIAPQQLVLRAMSRLVETEDAAVRDPNAPRMRLAPLG